MTSFGASLQVAAVLPAVGAHACEVAVVPHVVVLGQALGCMSPVYE